MMILLKTISLLENEQSLLRHLKAQTRQATIVRAHRHLLRSTHIQVLLTFLSRVTWTLTSIRQHHWTTFGQQQEE